MASGDISSTTTTNFSGTVPDFIMQAKSLDYDSDSTITYHYFDYAPKYYGYYLNDPIIFSAANNLATWAFGKGWGADPRTKVEFEHISGRGNDSFATIMWNHEIVKLVVGDSFCEIIWNSNKTILLNLIPISPERVRIASENGRIKFYDVWDGKKWKKIVRENMLHSSNKRLGDQVHGTSQILPIKKYLEARNEAFDDERVIKHRDKALGIVYYKTNNEGKISYANQQIEKAVKNGEMVGLPEGTAEIKPYPSKSSEDRTGWIQYIENFTYQTFGVPRSIASSDGTSEVGGKMGHVIFEPIYTKEQADEEMNIWLTMGRKINFYRPPSLGGLMQETEQKNTGQLNIQPNDVTANMNRE